MKNLKFTLLSFAFILIATMLRAQTADEIIAKCIDALGGKDKITQITSMYMENSMEVMGNESLSKTTILNGKGIKTVSEVMGQTMVQCYTDKGGWMINPMGGSSDATPMTDEQYKAGKGSIFVGEGFIDYATKENKVELLGKEKVGSVDAYKLKVVTKDNITTFYFIDPTTYYIIQSSMTADMMGQQMEIVTTMSDYRKTDFGYVVPYAYEISYGGQFNISMKLKKVEFNQPVDPKFFDLGNK